MVLTKFTSRQYNFCGANRVYIPFGLTATRPGGLGGLAGAMTGVELTGGRRCALHRRH
jgi:hypothetical protein